jgi:uncharacterized membrane protein YbhN (UPF0104 family)
VIHDEPDDADFDSGRGLAWGTCIGAIFWLAVAVTLWLCGWGDGI